MGDRTLLGRRCSEGQKEGCWQRPTPPSPYLYSKEGTRKMSNKRKKRGSFLDFSRSNSTSSSEDRRSPLTLYSRLRIGLLFQVLPNTPSPASSPPPSGNRRTKMDGRVPSRDEEEEWGFDSNCSEASEGSDQDSLGWLNALANSTFEESSWISRKSSEPKRGVATTPTNT